MHASICVEFTYLPSHECLIQGHSVELSPRTCGWYQKLFNSLKTSLFEMPRASSIDPGYPFLSAMENKCEKKNFFNLKYPFFSSFFCICFIRSVLNWGRRKNLHNKISSHHFLESLVCKCFSVVEWLALFIPYGNGPGF